MIQKEMHAAKMEFVMDALQTQTVKVLVANEDEFKHFASQIKGKKR